MRLTIDVFKVCVVKCVQGLSSLEEHIELVYLMFEPEHVKPEARVGGRFWVLTGADDGEGDEDADVAPPSPPSATPLDFLCDFLSVGYDEADVAATIDEILPVDDPARVGLSARETTEMVRRVVHRRTAAAAARP